MRGHSVCRVCGIAATVVVCLVMIQPAMAIDVLFHGEGVEATTGADGDVLAHLQSRYDNVTYMQGDMAASDGSSANGFDLVVISRRSAPGRFVASMKIRRLASLIGNKH